VFLWILPYTVGVWSYVLYGRMAPMVRITKESGPLRGNAVT